MVKHWSSECHVIRVCFPWIAYWIHFEDLQAAHRPCQAQYPHVRRDFRFFSGEAQVPFFRWFAPRTAHRAAGVWGLCGAYTTSTSVGAGAFPLTSDAHLEHDLCRTLTIFLSFSFRQWHLHLGPLQPAGRADGFCTPRKDIDSVSFTRSLSLPTTS